MVHCFIDISCLYLSLKVDCSVKEKTTDITRYSLQQVNIKQQKP